MNSNCWKSFQTCIHLFHNTKENISKNMGNQTVEKILWQSMGPINYLVTDIFQNIFFCVQHKKEIHTGLEQLQGEQLMTEFKFFGELSLY